MNTKSLLTRIAVPVLSLGLLGGLAALATSASASTMATTFSAVNQSGTVTANTHLNNHPDTTSASGTATVPSPGGPVWAYDNITEKFTVTPGTAAGTYSVTVDIVGSFHGFADPRLVSEGSSDPGGPLVSDGSVKGSISYTVTSPNAPDPSLLPGQSASDATLSQNITALFGGTVTFVGFGPYTFTYHKVAGADYVQVG
jgi:hypothetical protein